MGLRLCISTVHTTPADSDHESCPSLVQVTLIRQFQSDRLLRCHWYTLLPGHSLLGTTGACKPGTVSGSGFPSQKTHLVWEAFHPTQLLMEARRPQGNLYGARDSPHGLPGAGSFTHASGWVEPSSVRFLLGSRNRSLSHH